MIGFLRGKLVAKKAPSLLLDVRGVGYEVEAPMSTFYDLPSLGEEVMLYTHLVVREDMHSLFGFLTESDRALFRSLIKVNGVGARLALTILSGLSAQEFHRCIQDHDAQSLVRLPGVGKKTAERLMIEMRDRLPENGELALPTGRIPTPPSATANPAQEAASALIALGFKPQEANQMIRAVPAEGKSAEEIIRLALQSAGR